MIDDSEAQLNVNACYMKAFSPHAHLLLNAHDLQRAVSRNQCSWPFKNKPRFPDRRGVKPVISAFLLPGGNPLLAVRHSPPTP